MSVSDKRPEAAVNYRWLRPLESVSIGARSPRPRRRSLGERRVNVALRDVDLGSAPGVSGQRSRTNTPPVTPSTSTRAAPSLRWQGRGEVMRQIPSVLLIALV